MNSNKVRSMWVKTKDGKGMWVNHRSIYKIKKDLYLVEISGFKQKPKASFKQIADYYEDIKGKEKDFEVVSGEIADFNFHEITQVSVIYPGISGILK